MTQNNDTSNPLFTPEGINKLFDEVRKKTIDRLDSGAPDTENSAPTIDTLMKIFDEVEKETIGNLDEGKTCDTPPLDLLVVDRSVRCRRFNS